METIPVKKTDKTSAIVGLFDVCKGIAIVWIMLVHALHGWFGWQGVHVFIVLAGFTLTYACLRRENQLKWPQWFQRRAARILPAYWLVATAGFLVVWAVAVLAPSERRPFDLTSAVLRALGDLTLLRNFSYKTILSDPNSSLWFVPMIGSLYLIFPLLYSSLANRSINRWVKVLVIAAVVEVVYRASAIYWLDGMPVAYGHGFLKSFARPASALDQVGDAFPFQLWAPFGLAPSRVGEFAVGMVGALALQRHSTRFTQLVLSSRAAICGVALWLSGSLLLLTARWTWAFTDLIIASGLVLWLLNAASLVHRLLPRLFRAVSRLGVWSYYLFLTHLLFGYAFANLYTLWAGSTVLVVIMLLLTLAAMVGAIWLLLCLDRSALPKRVFSVGSAIRQRAAVNEAKVYGGVKDVG